MSTTIDNLPAVVFAYAGTSDVKLDAIDATTGKVVLSATQKTLLSTELRLYNLNLSRFQKGMGMLKLHCGCRKIMALLRSKQK